MLELVYPGEERSRLFAMLFLHRLTPAVRLQFTEDDYEDVRALAEKADRCAASIHCHQQLIPVFATTTGDCEDSEEQPDYPITAVGSYRFGRSSQWSRGGQNWPKGGRGPRTAAAPPSRSPASPSWPSRLVYAATTS